MKLIPYLLVVGLFLFSCNKDDDSSDSEYKSGWSNTLINFYAQECAKILGDYDTCLCTTKETAKLYSVSQINNGLSTEQQEKINSVSIENCGTEFVD